MIIYRWVHELRESRSGLQLARLESQDNIHPGIYIFQIQQDPNPQTLGISQEYTLQKWQTPISWRWPEWTYHLTTEQNLHKSDPDVFCCIEHAGYRLWICPLEVKRESSSDFVADSDPFGQALRRATGRVRCRDRNVSDKSHWDWRDIWF